MVLRPVTCYADYYSNQLYSYSDMAGRVTSKGQITLPLEIRERLGIHPGSVVEFELRDDAVVVRKTKDGGRGAALVARLRGAATGQLSTDEIMQLTRS